MEFLLLASFVGILKGLLMFLFVLLGLLLVLVVLLQEPKGGGLSAAFGGAGAETFGVQTGGVNRFTAWVSGIWMCCAILYAAIPEDSDHTVLTPDNPAAESTEQPGGQPAEEPEDK